MLPDRVSNPGPLTYESGALPIALRGPVRTNKHMNKTTMKFCAHWSTVCGMVKSDAGGNRTQ